MPSDVVDFVMLASITAELEREGVAPICDSCRELFDCIDRKLEALAAVAS